MEACREEPRSYNIMTTSGQEKQATPETKPKREDVRKRAASIQPLRRHPVSLNPLHYQTQQNLNKRIQTQRISAQEVGG